MVIRAHATFAFFSGEGGFRLGELPTELPIFAGPQHITALGAAYDRLARDRPGEGHDLTRQPSAPITIVLQQKTQRSEQPRTRARGGWPS